jgi:hypothetical protein
MSEKPEKTVISQLHVRQCAMHGDLTELAYIFICTKPSLSRLVEWKMAKATAWLFLSRGSTHPFSRFMHPFPQFKPSCGYQSLAFGRR